MCANVSFCFDCLIVCSVFDLPVIIKSGEDVKQVLIKNMQFDLRFLYLQVLL